VTVNLKAQAVNGNGLIEIRGPDGKPLKGVPVRLESCFAASRVDWEFVAGGLPADDRNDRGHFGTCAPNVSDYGLLLAWAKLVAELAGQADIYVVSCADPWLFRHLAGLSGVSAERPPGLRGLIWKFRLRGYLARGRAAMAMVGNCLAFRRQAPRSAGRWLMVYGHPASTADGRDGYFGDLMQRQPDLQRVLHVDCGPDRARALAADGRTFSLHGYGSLLYALSLIFRTWQLPASSITGPNSWLIRRSLTLDSGYAGAAMIAWQIHCQERWLTAVSPDIVHWPWENHGWERSFCRALRVSGSYSVGYQHSVVGQQWNLAPASNPDGATSLPDRIFCNGKSGFRQLLAAGHSEGKLVVAGALRFPTPEPVAWSASAPVFVAVPFDLEVARQMVEACRAVADRQFVIRVHPMTPLDLRDDGNIVAATGPLSAQSAVSAVLFAATTVGLEAWMIGLPVLRFQPEGCIAIDILPEELSVLAADRAGLSEGLDRIIAEGVVKGRCGEDIFTPVDIAVWEEYPMSIIAPSTTESVQEMTT
jgi:hypothetical protein